jgi:antitoxin (DNA-binding transcriptional repressor) of toxin-antitoxin stability system
MPVFRVRAAVHTILRLAGDLARFVVGAVGSRAQLSAENLFLRKQLALYVERRARYSGCARPRGGAVWPSGSRRPPRRRHADSRRSSSRVPARITSCVSPLDRPRDYLRTTPVRMNQFHAVVGHESHPVTGRRPPRHAAEHFRESMTIYGHNMTMRQVRIAELKARLSEYLRAVRRGETIAVLDRETLVAQIVPVRERTALRIRKPTPGTPPPNRVPLPKPLKSTIDVVQQLLEERQPHR